jgi:hypothetical protein
MWNRSGLPAVFPLQIKTAPGPDYMLRLIDVQSGKPVLAAYIEGGRFFRVLVPPGTFRLHFASGLIWRGEEDLFGPGTSTEQFELQQPLRFGTRGLGRKAGHIIDLRDRTSGRLAQGARRDQVICQTLRSVLPALQAGPAQIGIPAQSLPGIVTRFEIRSRLCG